MGSPISKQCAVCGNEYDKLIQITKGGQTLFFDCFECAIHAMAPHCEGCGLHVIGHGVEVDNLIFCSAQCARKHGKVGLSDRLPFGVYGSAHT
jgi:hypothetical protein